MVITELKGGKKNFKIGQGSKIILMIVKVGKNTKKKNNS